jgi:hypothetical protein
LAQLHTLKSPKGCSNSHDRSSGLLI